jgi:plastocyanin
LRILAALRLLADPGEDSGADFALAGGLVLRLTRDIGVSADVASVTNPDPGERVAWAAGLNLAIPHTPHTISLHATNTNNATLQSSSRGTGETRYGFEFTIPVTLSRYFGGRHPAPPSPSAGEAAPPAMPGADTVAAAIQDFTFRPNRIEVSSGTTVVWTNGGQVAHSVTAENGGFDTELIEAGDRRGLTFTKPGTYPFHCTPHPFMTGVIVVH